MIGAGVEIVDHRTQEQAYIIRKLIHISCSVRAQFSKKYFEQFFENRIKEKKLGLSRQKNKQRILFLQTSCHRGE